MVSTRLRIHTHVQRLRADFQFEKAIHSSKFYGRDLKVGKATCIGSRDNPGTIPGHERVRGTLLIYDTFEATYSRAVFPSRPTFRLVILQFYMSVCIFPFKIFVKIQFKCAFWFMWKDSFWFLVITIFSLVTLCVW